MMLTTILVIAALTALIRAQAPDAESFVVPASFPSSIFNSYYVPASPTQNPQPAIHDPVSGVVSWCGSP